MSFECYTFLISTAQRCGWN